MIKLNADELNLLKRVLEHRPDVGRRGNPRLRPLSMYSSELKNFTQVAAEIKRIADGGTSGDATTTSRRYANTLWNMGLWTSEIKGTDIGQAGEKILEIAAANVDQPDFWQGQTRPADKIFFVHQLNRLVGSDEERALVSDMWRSVFYNVQDLCDHISEADLRVALNEVDLKELETLQYMDSVGTEPWRYARLSADERIQVQTMMLHLRSRYDKNQNVAAGDDLAAAIEYAKAIATVQRDVRYRVAGFLEAFLDLRAEMGSEFPRIAPNYLVTLPPAHATHSSASAVKSGRSRGKLPLPLQVIISGCPGSGKSYLAEKAADGALTIRTQFHAETTTATFVGGYKPAPVYEPGTDVVEVSGAAFGRGRPLIDYRFVPGPALLAVAEAIADPERNVVLLIEELNRGNAAAIFGELFQLLDRADDGWSRYGVSIGAEAEEWLRTKDALGADGTIRLPPNLHLWATMNSGDQGVFPIDTAFRRRWSYRYLGYAEPCAYPKLDSVLRFAGRDLDWDRFRHALNRRLKSAQVVEDRLIGPYFLTRSQLRNPHEVLSKLLLYLWDDVLRFRQHELFKADSFAGVTTDWRNGAGNPLLEGVIDLELAACITGEDEGLAEVEAVAAGDDAADHADDGSSAMLDPSHATDLPEEGSEAVT